MAIAANCRQVIEEIESHVHQRKTKTVDYKLRFEQHTYILHDNISDTICKKFRVKADPFCSKAKKQRSDSKLVILPLEHAENSWKAFTLEHAENSWKAICDMFRFIWSGTGSN